MTSIALVSCCLITLAVWTKSSYESVSQEPVTSETVKLLQSLLKNVALVKIIIENLLDDFLVFLSRGSSKVIKVNIKVLINSLMNDMILVTYFLRTAALLHGLGFGSCSVFISAANVDGVVARKLAESAEDITRQDCPNKIAKMRLVVDIWKSRCDKDIIRAVWINIEHSAFVALKFLGSYEVNILLRNLLFLFEFFGFFFWIFLVFFVSFLFLFVDCDF